jgi:hypothetical protein
LNERQADEFEYVHDCFLAPAGGGLRHR